LFELDIKITIVNWGKNRKEGEKEL